MVVFLPLGAESETRLKFNTLISRNLLWLDRTIDWLLGANEVDNGIHSLVDNPFTNPKDLFVPKRQVCHI